MCDNIQTTYGNEVVNYTWFFSWLIWIITINIQKCVYSHKMMIVHFLSDFCFLIIICLFLTTEIIIVDEHEDDINDAIYKVENMVLLWVFGIAWYIVLFITSICDAIWKNIPYLCLLHGILGIIHQIIFVCLIAYTINDRIVIGVNIAYSILSYGILFAFGCLRPG